MKRTRKFYVGATIAAVIVVLATAQYTLQTVARAQENGSANRAGIYEVDRMWPKPLPNNWVLGSTVGLAIDARDHVFVVHRGQASLDQKFASQMAFTPPAPRGGGGRAGAAPAPGFAAPSAGNTVTGYSASDMTKPISEFCCSAAPPVLEFDAEGRLAALAFHPGERAVLSARWSDWRTLDTGAFPHRLELELPEAQTRWKLEYRQVELDPALDPALFRLGLGTR